MIFGVVCLVAMETISRTRYDNILNKSSAEETVLNKKNRETVIELNRSTL